MIFVGDDWAVAHHDIELQDAQGQRLARRRLPEGVEGIAALHALLAEHVEEPSEVVVGIETDRGLWVQALVAAGYQVYAINPLAASRYRERHVTSGAKSDPGDARVLCELVRLDRQHHRLVAADSELAEAVRVLARGHQSLIWTRRRQTNALRDTLRSYYPAALAVFGDALDSPDAVAVLSRAPRPEQGRSLSRAQIASALRRGGRQRNIESRAAEIQAGLRSAQLQAPAAVAAAFAAAAAASIAVIGELNVQIGRLEAELAEAFQRHPDAEILNSLPGLGVVLGARVLGEFGDAPNRYQDGKARRCYAGTAPITRQSGRRRSVHARYARNDRLADAVYLWAFASLRASPGCRALYDHQRTRGQSHNAALRALGNRLVGILHGCLRHHTPYDEQIAWSHRFPLAA
jgi:hypothetical protein